MSEILAFFLLGDSLKLVCSKRIEEIVMTYRGFLKECRRLRKNGWKAFKGVSGEIRLEMPRVIWSRTPLSAVCEQLGGVRYSTAEQDFAANDIGIGSRVAKRIGDASAHRSQDFIANPAARRWRRDLLKAFRLKKD